ncbi:MAG: hypothetical protein WCG85_28225 [Polyangia bacterium]
MIESEFAWMNDTLYAASEVFFTGTACEVTPSRPPKHDRSSDRRH